MTMHRIETLDHAGTFEAYLARPSGQAKAAIVVIQEIFGVNEGIRRKCDAWAEAGYLALAPDLFWRLEPGVQLDPDMPEQFQQALQLMGRFDQEQGVKDIEATIRAARGLLGSAASGEGRLAFMTATRTDVDASVGYYGVGIDNLLRESHAIAHPLMLHIAGADHFVGPEIQRAMHEGLDGHPRVTLCDYPGLDHGFAAEMGKRRNEEGARLADRRTAEFFAANLA